MLYPDLTLFIQMGIFLVTFIVMSKVFFKPYMALFDARDEAQGIDRGAGAHDNSHDQDAAEDQVAAAPDTDSLTGLKSRVESLTADLHAQTAAMRNSAMNDAQSSIQSMMKNAGDEANESIIAAKDRVDALRDEVWNSLAAEKSGYLSNLQEKLLA